ncbi:MAG: 2-amino-4-hydroxy-6-hydroxymethyldihydropteridine diphosphokinase [bacterium]
MKQVILSLGSNLGDRLLYLRKALETIGRLEKTRIVKYSWIYKTEPVGKQDQPYFLNAAVEIETDHPPHDLIRLLKEVEIKIGRRHTERWGPREIDLDILYYDKLILHDAELQIPHPELYNRRFALIMVSDLNPLFLDPGKQETLQNLLAQCSDKSSVQKTECSLQSIFIES